MCTCLALQGDRSYFGRNMDLEYTFGEQVVITPRNFLFQFRREPEMSSHYAMIGMATVASDYPLYAEAVNEKGLGMAGLNFPGNACYQAEREKSGHEIAPYEIIPWVLGQCATVEEARTLLEQTRMLDMPFSETIGLAPLHWMIADGSHCLTVEPVETGLKVQENPVGVLTNNPVFEFQMMNLNQYLNLTAKSPDNRFGSQLALTPFGQGMGGLGLPGDFSPVSRFVKTAFLKENSVCEDTEEASVSQFFHILDSVAMVRGSVITREQQYDITTYTCCVNMEKGIYYYKTYDNPTVFSVDMRLEDLDGAQLSVYPLEKTWNICCQNAKKS